MPKPGCCGGAAEAGCKTKASPCCSTSASKPVPAEKEGPQQQAPAPAAAAAAAGKPKKTFYRRPLPEETCVDFASKEGKRLFHASLTAEPSHCGAYFPLISQFTTQSEPAFCGLASLCMSLNALGLDPNRLWKGPWRWFAEEQLSCCKPLPEVIKSGVTMPQLACLGRCNGAHIETVFAEDTTLEELRKAVSECTIAEDRFLIASYSRKTLGQTGTGHFSPIGAYEPVSDKVLILDTARFKYPPHWVDLPLLFEAMQACDPDTGRSRGFHIVTKKETESHLALFASFHGNLAVSADVHARIAAILAAVRGGEQSIEDVLSDVAAAVGSVCSCMPGQEASDENVQVACARRRLVDALHTTRIFAVAKPIASNCSCSLSGSENDGTALIALAVLACIPRDLGPSSWTELYDEALASDRSVGMEVAALRAQWTEWVA